LQVTFEEGTWATWLYDLLKPHAVKLVVCDPRKNSRQGKKNDRIDARELADRLYMNKALGEKTPNEFAKEIVANGSRGDRPSHPLLIMQLPRQLSY
jgi:transposase